MGNVVNLYWKLENTANGISQLLNKIGEHPGIICRSAISFKNINKGDVFVIHGCYSRHIVSYLIVLVLCRCRFYWCPHGSLQKNTLKKSYIRKYLFHLFISTLVYYFSQGVIYVSDQERKRSIASFKGRSRVIDNGLDKIGEPFFEEKTTRPPEFIYIGRLDPYHKGLDRLADWAAPLGNSLKVFGPLNEEIQEQLPSLNFKGPIFGVDKVRELLGARALIMLSRHEGLPVIAIEALRAGTPLILTDECNMSDVIYKYNCGFIVNSQQELVAACSYFSEMNDETFMKYSQNAVNAFQDCYTLEKMIVGYRNLT